MTQLEHAKAALVDALRAAGLTPEQIARVSPAVARYTADAVRVDRIQQKARAFAADLDTLVRRHAGR